MLSGALIPDNNRIADYFSRKLGADCKTLSVKQSFPGISRQTWLLKMEVSGEEQGFVLRFDPPWGASVPQSLKHEWLVYSHLWRTAIPVAEALWYEDGQDFLGGLPLMVRRFVDGSPGIPGLAENSAQGRKLRRRVADEHVEQLARLHLLDWKAHGFGDFLNPPEAPGQSFRKEFDYWSRFWRTNKTAPFPVISEALYWLEDNIPQDTPRISLVKGNNGVGEEIWSPDGRIVAFSDFELATLGDSAMDLAFSQGTLELCNFDASIRYYEQCVGHSVSPERLAFAGFWIKFKAIACLNCCLMRGFLARNDPRLAPAAFELTSAKAYEHQLAAAMGRNIVEAWAEVSGRERGSYASLGGQS